MTGEMFLKQCQIYAEKLKAKNLSDKNLPNKVAEKYTSLKEEELINHYDHLKNKKMINSKLSELYFEIAKQKILKIFNTECEECFDFGYFYINDEIEICTCYFENLFSKDFESNIENTVVNGKTFEKWLDEYGAQDSTMKETRDFYKAWKAGKDAVTMSTNNFLKNFESEIKEFETNHKKTTRKT